MRKLLLALATLSMLATSCTALAMAPATAEEDTSTAKTTTYTFGGENGQWETDADNSTGVWSYYVHWGNLASKYTDLVLSEDGTKYSNGEDYLSICRNGFMHPGMTSPWSGTLVGLTIEYDGYISGTMVATRENVAANGNQFATEDNGSMAKFMLNSNETPIVEKAVYELETTMEMSNVEVRKGDVVYFMVHHLNNCAYDGATYVLNYTLTEADFSLKEPEISEDATVYIFGGENGQWETDLGNTEGIWSYYGAKGTVATKTTEGMDYNSNNSQYGFASPEIYFGINKSGFTHPSGGGEYYMPLVGLTMEKSGTLMIIMKAAKGEATGNGVTAKFYLNDDDHLLGSQEVTTTQTVLYVIEEVTVEEGDVVYMLVHSNDDIACDATTFEVKYALVEAKDVTPVIVCDCQESCTHTEETCYCSNYCDCETCASFQDKLDGDTDSVNNVDDFRFIQGKNNLTYLYGKVSEGIEGLQQLPNTTNTNWDTAGEVPYMGVRLDGLLHPGYTSEGYMAAIAWTSPKTQVIDVYFDAIFETVEGNNGDGVTVGIYLNGTCLHSFNLLPEYFVQNGEEALVLEWNSISVNEGDVLYFTVSPNEAMSFDGLMTYMEISYLKATEDEGNNNSGNTNSGDSTNSGSTNSGDSTNSGSSTSGCGSSIGVASCALIGSAILAAASVVLKKKKEE